MSYPVRPSRWRPHAQRRAAQQWAAWSAERCIKRLTSGLKCADPLLREVARREAVARPALTAAVAEFPISDVQVLKRNCALHSRHLPSATAPLSSWRAAQRGPRLSFRRAPSRSVLPLGEPPPGLGLAALAGDKQLSGAQPLLPTGARDAVVLEFELAMRAKYAGTPVFSCPSVGSRLTWSFSSAEPYLDRPLPPNARAYLLRDVEASLVSGGLRADAPEFVPQVGLVLSSLALELGPPLHSPRLAISSPPALCCDVAVQTDGHDLGSGPVAVDHCIHSCAGSECEDVYHALVDWASTGTIGATCLGPHGDAESPSVPRSLKPSRRSAVRNRKRAAVARASSCAASVPVPERSSNSSELASSGSESCCSSSTRHQVFGFHCDDAISGSDSYIDQLLLAAPWRK